MSRGGGRERRSGANYIRTSCRAAPMSARGAAARIARMQHYLRPLLAPKSVALVGASERPGSLGRIVFENLLAGRFSGTLYPVNPHHSRVLSQRTYATLADIGSAIDLAVIATPAATVPEIL